VGSGNALPLPRSGALEPVASRSDMDAKPQTKTILAGKDIASQYVLGKNANGIIQPKVPDHPAEMALLDLYRSGQLVQAPRVGAAG
jgi:hypothetical protein